ncbi:MAG: dihydropteroate synthase [Acidobacteria bacterium]|nr:dihydropteroate synthase [Acidobacteriota bacterium]
MPPISPRANFTISLPGRAPLQLGARTLVMGVLNITPDSFSDGGLTLNPDAAVNRGLELEAAGADLLDLGAESTRPGAHPVSAEDEWERLLPVVRRLVGSVRVPLSVDTYKAEVARRAIDSGATIINDISGLRYDAGLAGVVASAGAALIVMHTRGRSRDMYGEARYEDVVAETCRELQWSLDRAAAAGVDANQLIVDPGLGFAKHASHSLAMLADLDRLSGLGRPLLVGPSRKSFLTAATGPLAPQERDWATVAAVAVAVLAGAHFVRVHHVAGVVQAVRVADAVRAAAGR